MGVFLSRGSVAAVMVTIHMIHSDHIRDLALLRELQQLSILGVQISSPVQSRHMACADSAAPR